MCETPRSAQSTQPPRRQAGEEHGSRSLNAIKDKVEALTEDHPSLRGALFSRNEYRRFYPAGPDAAPLLGLGQASTGREGLERTLNRHLAGETRRFIQWRDRKGRRITTDVPEARPGNTVVLTIDRQIQRIAEEALDGVMERSAPDTASAVVIDPETGAILAMAQRPTHNPNDTRNIKQEALRNRAVADIFEPGSVFKLFVAAAVVEEGLVTKDTLIDCENGRFRIGRNTISDEHPEKIITISEVIKVSSNIGAAKLAFNLGPERTLGYLKDFGFSRPTNLGLSGEASGRMQRAETIKPIELATTSYGHGVNSTTPARCAMATLANEGVRMEPHIVSEIRDPSGVAIRIFEPNEDRRVVSKHTAEETLEMMVTVTEPGVPAHGPPSMDMRWLERRVRRGSTWRAAATQRRSASAHSSVWSQQTPRGSPWPSWSTTQQRIEVRWFNRRSRLRGDRRGCPEDDGCTPNPALMKPAKDTPEKKQELPVPTAEPEPALERRRRLHHARPERSEHARCTGHARGCRPLGPTERHRSCDQTESSSRTPTWPGDAVEVTLQ